jgi:hypothetical protein
MNKPKIYGYVESVIPGLLAAAAIAFGLALLLGPAHVRLVAIVFAGMCATVPALGRVR